MQTIRGSLTRLKTKINERIPEGDDVYGYPGVNREELVSYVERAYGLTSKLEELKGQFAIVALKRALAPLVTECKDYFEHKSDGKKAVEEFDGFLRSLTRIHDEIFLAYIVYCSSNIRTESEVELALSNLSLATTSYGEAKPQVDQVLADLERIKDLRETSDGSAEEIESKLTDAKALHAQLTALISESTANAQIITKYEGETKGQKQQLIDLMAKLNGADNKLKKLLSEGTSHAKEIDSTLESAKDLLKRNQEHQESINETLRLASKYGMAASFKERKDELKTSMALWGAAFAVAVLGIFATGAFYILPQFAHGAMPKAEEIIIKLSLAAPLVWLGWMAAKQYGYISRIREDYSFKYASALAFEGYKKEASEVDQNMLRDLLSVATENMSLNPLRIYHSGDPNHASPLHEILSKVADKIDTKDLTKDLSGTVKSMISSKISPKIDP